MARIESQSDRTAHRLKNFLLPGAAELAIYALLSMILVIVFNTSVIINNLGDDYLKAAQNLKASASVISDGFSASFSSALGGRLGQIAFWSFIGALAYIALWLSKNVLNSFENDVIIDHYLHPTSFSRAGYWGSSLSVKVFLAAGTLMTAAYTYLLYAAIFPAIASLAASASYNFTLKTSPAYLVLCVVMGTVALYLARLLLRLVVHLWQLL